MQTSRSGGAGETKRKQSRNKSSINTQTFWFGCGLSTSAFSVGKQRVSMEMLRAKLYDIKLQRSCTAQRKTMVSQVIVLQKIKTYNYPQGRVTDHRINKSIYNLDLYEW